MSAIIKQLVILLLVLPLFTRAAPGPVATIPFTLEQGSIMLKARINNSARTLNLLFDTGADGMALNGNLADSLGLKIARSQQASVVGGTMQIDIATNNTYHFDAFDLPGQNIGIFRNNQLGFDGIVGIGLARRYVLNVDFDRHVIELYEPGTYTYPADGVTLPMLLRGNTPMIHLALKAGRATAEGDFVFDTGAHYNVIGFGPFVKANKLLLSGFDPYDVGSTVSMGQASNTYAGYLDWVQVGQFRFDKVPGTLQAFRPGDEQWAHVGDGSLGILLIARWNFVLDLGNRQFNFRPSKQYNAGFSK